MNVLVTGAGGFLGQYIAEQLVARGDRVRSFSRQHHPRLETLGVEQLAGDVRDPTALTPACHNIDTVFHVAGVAGIWGPWQHYHGINTLGTANLIAAARRSGVQRLVYTSSPSVTFDSGHREGIDESAPYASRWPCHYPHSKALAEQQILDANTQDGLLTCALRPHLIWGPRDQHLIPRLLERARRGQLRRVGDGSNRVDMIYVENAAAAHLLAADRLVAHSPVGGSAYFISQGEPVNCWQWIDQILAAAGLHPVTKSISLTAAWYLGGAMELTHHLLRRRAEPRMTRFLAAQLAMSHYFDITRARQHFDYAPTISTEEGMERLARALSDDGPVENTGPNG